MSERERHEPNPYAFAHRYPDGIRFGTGGREINGSPPIETIRLYDWGQLQEAYSAGEQSIRAAIDTRLSGLAEYWKFTEQTDADDLDNQGQDANRAFGWWCACQWVKGLLEGK